MAPNGQQHENMDDKNATGSSIKGPVNAGRRRFARSGVAASGIIATLSSGPVLGAVCKSPSAALSGNLSNHHQETMCAGRSPGYWKTKHTWPVSKDLKFSQIFTPYLGSPLNTMTLLEVLSVNGKSSDAYNLAMHLVAGYLNYKMGWSPFLTDSRLQSMWIELNTGDKLFEPTAGVRWTAEQVVSYIQSTFGGE